MPVSFKLWKINTNQNIVIKIRQLNINYVCPFKSGQNYLPESQISTYTAQRFGFYSHLKILSIVAFVKSSKHVKSMMFYGLLRKIGNGKSEILFAHSNWDTIICQNLQFDPISCNSLDFRAIWKFWVLSSLLNL